MDGRQIMIDKIRDGRREIEGADGGELHLA